MPSSSGFPSHTVPRGLTIALLCLGTLVPTRAHQAQAQENEPEEPSAPAEAPLGRRSSIALAPDRPTVLIAPGSRLRQSPDPCSATLFLFRDPVETEALEERENWLRLRHRAWVGWLWNGKGAEPANCTSVPAYEFDSLEVETEDRYLETALQLLTEPVHHYPEGLVALYTNVSDRAPRERIQKILEQIPNAYETRYGLEAEAGGATVVVFGEESEYRVYSRQTTHREDLESRGHAGLRTAATYWDPGFADHSTATLVHEVVHLINRSTLRVDLPPWLEEGLATDLEFHEIDKAGRLKPGSLSGGARVGNRTVARDSSGRLLRMHSVVRSGGVAALRSLVDSPTNDQIHLRALLEIDAETFLDADQRTLLYAQSAFFVRFLLEPRNGYRDRFHAFLSSVAEGENADNLQLERHLGTTLVELDPPFRRWLRTQSLRH